MLSAIFLSTPTAGWFLSNNASGTRRSEASAKAIVFGIGGYTGAISDSCSCTALSVRDSWAVRPSNIVGTNPANCNLGLYDCGLG